MMDFYGSMNEQAVQNVRLDYRISDLVLYIDAMDELVKSHRSELGLRELLMRLYGISASLLCNANPTVPPHDGDLPTLLQTIKSDLEVATAFFQRGIALIEPLEQLPARQAMHEQEAAANVPPRRSQPSQRRRRAFR